MLMWLCRKYICMSYEWVMSYEIKYGSEKIGEEILLMKEKNTKWIVGIMWNIWDMWKNCWIYIVICEELYCCEEYEW